MKLTQRLIPVNVTRGREGHLPIDTIVIHVTEGSAGSVVSWFSNPAAKASAHYQVRKNGDIDHFVKDEDTAWHAGRVHRPTAEIVRERDGINPNSYSIGIEHEGDGREDLTPPQREASIWLIRQLLRAHPAIKVNRRHIIGHREVFSLKTCPGEIDVGRLVGEVARAEAGVSEKPRLVYSRHLQDWLIVTKVTSDTDWEFVPFKRLTQIGGIRAATSLSQMPSRP